MSKTVPIVIAFAVLATMAGLYMVGQSGNNFLKTPTYDQVFESWCQTFGKVYSSEEKAYRKQIFIENARDIDYHNRHSTSYTLGLNQFSDMTNFEYKMKLGVGLKASEHVPLNVKDINVAIPSTVNWVTQGAVTPIKNQGQCGSCYTFSSTGSMEGLHFIDTQSLLSFSEQQLVDCSQSYGNQGCNGGLMDYCFQYSIANGIELESSYPYTGVTGSCAYDKSKVISWRPSGYTNVPANSTSSLQAAIAQQPVSVAIDASGFDFQSYSGGVFSASCGTSLDHGVLAVGYTSTYILVKNSWGASWGLNGYIQMAIKNGAGQCGINMMASYPTG